MTINKKKLFDKTQALWPKVLKQDTLLAQSSLAQVLNDLYYRIEASISENDHWMQISIWAYYQALPKESNGEITDFSPHDVDFDEFDRMMVQNLNGDECWAEERNIYLSSEVK
ncbi:hypothetical protein [Marinagarivorans algicola]|uniref:hypothetical protein n=1 Tax=Marinagarivorans algicola TaxID=1513270 RepID=UPI0006B9A24E|nr:hypothetical protein [Marinagarivorans algicola]